MKWTIGDSGSLGDLLTFLVIGRKTSALDSLANGTHRLSQAESALPEKHTLGTPLKPNPQNHLGLNDLPTVGSEKRHG